MFSASFWRKRDSDFSPVVENKAGSEGLTCIHLHAMLAAPQMTICLIASSKVSREVLGLWDFWAVYGVLS